MILTYQGKTPLVGREVFIAPTAVVIGDVTIADGASVWYGAVIRGDLAPILVGKNTNIQDNCTVHVDAQTPASIGDNVTVGHNAVIHGCTLEEGCLIGINAVVLNRAFVRTGSVVAAGALVREGQVVGPHELVAGTPASVKRQLQPEDRQRLQGAVADYLVLGREHAALLDAGLMRGK
jgi:carbonic anhydrase/acetyltransferase-like protein (isoleucine patch superfamily)